MDLYPNFLQVNISESHYKELQRVSESIGESSNHIFELMAQFVTGECYSLHSVDFVRELTAAFEDSLTEGFCAVYGLSVDTLASHEMYGVINTTVLSSVCVITEAALALRDTLQATDMPMLEHTKQCAYELCNTHERSACLVLRIPDIG